MTDVAYPDDERFLQDLILQRTGDDLQICGRNALERWFSDGDRSGLVPALRQCDGVARFLHATEERLRTDTAVLLSRLPPDAASVVSIGPGNGLVELFLYRQLRCNQLLLIDIEDTAAHAHGWAQQGSGYANLRASIDFLVRNGVPAAVLSSCNPLHEPLPPARYDLALSLLAMGFHFPCDDYVAFLLDSAQPDARIVLDKRRTAAARDPGYQRLLQRCEVESSTPFPKSDRVVLRVR